MINYYEIGDVVTCVDDKNMEMKLNEGQEYIVKSRTVIDGDFVYGVVSKVGYETWGDDVEEIYCTDRFEGTGENYSGDEPPTPTQASKPIEPNPLTEWMETVRVDNPIVADEMLNIMEGNVNHPYHYNYGNIEVIDFIESTLPSEMAMGFEVANAIKYLSRAWHKGQCDEDLEKAKWYIDRLIDFKKEVDNSQ